MPRRWDVVILGFNRLYVLVPAALFIALVIAAHVVASTGMERLWASAQQTHAVQLRLRALGRVLSVVTDAQTSERGYLLSGEPPHLRSFRASGAALPAALDELRSAYAAEPRRFTRIESLISRRMAEMEQTLKARARGQAAGVASFGEETRTMEALRALIREAQAAEGARLRQIGEQSRRDLLITRMITTTGTALNVVLVLAAAFLIWRQIKQRMAEGRAMEAELERQVALRTEELSELSSHLQALAEREKSALARDLHDELGGLLVSAKMDVAALRRRWSLDDPETQARWDRVVAALDAGFDLKRRLVEQLHPTLLDNMGLYAALRWQFAESCRQANLHCTLDLPADELPLAKDAAIAVFRIAQEALTNIIKHAGATRAGVSVRIENDTLVLRVCDDGVGLDDVHASRSRGHGWIGMRHRAQAFGGTWEVRARPDAGTEIEVRLPLARIIESSAAHAGAAPPGGPRGFPGERGREGHRA